MKVAFQYQPLGAAYDLASGIKMLRRNPSFLVYICGPDETFLTKEVFGFFSILAGTGWLATM